MDAEPHGEDRELMRRWADGDAVAGTQLVQRHFSGIHGFLRDKVDPAALDDLTQQVFLAALEQLERYRGEGSFRAWLLGITRNVLLMHWRDRYAGQRALHKVEEQSLDELGASPSRVVAERERSRVLDLALRRIPLDLQILLELYYWEELQVDDVALVLAIPPGTVKSRLHRARQLLAVAMEELGASAELVQTSVQALVDRRGEPR